MKAGKTDDISRQELDAVSTVVFGAETYTSAGDIPWRRLSNGDTYVAPPELRRRNIHLFRRGISLQLHRPPRLITRHGWRFRGAAHLNSFRLGTQHVRIAWRRPCQDPRHEPHSFNFSNSFGTRWPRRGAQTASGKSASDPRPLCGKRSRFVARV